MSTMLSQAGWVVHEVGLATSIGGTLFGRAALEPSLEAVASASERDRVSAEAWKRFSWLNLAGHVAFAVPWFVGRSMLSGREVTRTARKLTRVKDVLIGASLITGVSSVLLGRRLGSRAEMGMGPEEMRDRPSTTPEGKKSLALEKTVGALGNMNLLINIGILGVTTILAMQAGKSARFAPLTRWLP